MGWLALLFIRQAGRLDEEARAVQVLLNLLWVGVLGQGGDDEMAVCAIAPYGDAIFLQGFAQGTRVGDDLLPIIAEGRLGGLAQRDGEGCEPVLVQG